MWDELCKQKKESYEQLSTPEMANQTCVGTYAMEYLITIPAPTEYFVAGVYLHTMDNKYEEKAHWDMQTTPMIV